MTDLVNNHQCKCRDYYLLKDVSRCRAKTYGNNHVCVCDLNASSRGFYMTCRAINHKCICTIDYTMCMCDHKSVCMCQKKCTSRGKYIQGHEFCISSDHKCICYLHSVHPYECVSWSHNCICHRGNKKCNALIHGCVCRRLPNKKCMARRHKRWRVK